MRNKFNIVGLGIIALCATSCGPSGYDNTRLVVGLECDYAPFNWTGIAASDFTLPISGQRNQFADGYDIQIARHLQVGLDVPITIKKISWDALIPALQSGEINVIIAGMSFSEDRDKEVDFSNPYYVSDLVAVVRKSSPLASATSIQDLGGYKVISQLGTLQDDLIDQIDDVVHMTGSKTFQTGALAVASTDADALIAEYPVAKAIVNANASLSIVNFSIGFTGFDQNEISVAVAVQEGNAELLDMINTELAKLDVEARTSLMDGAIERALA